MSTVDSLPDDVETLKRLVAARDAELARERARASSTEALFAHLRLTIEKLRREMFSPRSERQGRLLDRMELQLEELEAATAEDELVAERAAAVASTAVRAFTRRKPSRQPFPAHLPRERVVVPSPTACACCGSRRLAKLGEDVTATLEVVPRQWKVVQHVREKFTCRECGKITQVPAPFHVLPRGFAGPSLLAMILFEKYGQHQPLNRQAERYAREGVDLSLSTLADQVGRCAMLLRPLYDLVRAHVFAAERVHGDDTTVPVVAKHRTRTGRLWTYVRDDRPFAGHTPPAALFVYSRDRAAEHPKRHLQGYAGILQADAYAGFNVLYAPVRHPGPILEAACWAHARRKFFVLADVIAKARGALAAIAPLAFEGVKRIDLVLDVEREINGLSAANASRSAAPASHRWSPIWRPGCGASAPSSRAIPRSPRRWTTCSSAETASPGSSPMAAYARPTTPPSGRCAASRLGKVLGDLGTKTLRYLYDFGDGWRHTVKIERLADPEPGARYPRLIEISGRCPPEDVGGPWGYAEFLVAISDPEHERHAEFSEWIGDDFDVTAVDTEWLIDQVETLAGRWSRKTASKRSRQT